MNEIVLPPLDVGDVKQVKGRKTKAQLAEERNTEDLRQILSTPGGRYYLWKLMQLTGMYGRTQTADPYQVMMAIGARDVGLMVREDILSAHPSIWNTMEIEAKEREE